MENNSEIDEKSIIAFYNHTQDEMLRYRDIEWKICYWTIALLAGTIAAHKYLLEIIHEYSFYTSYGFNTFTLLISTYGIWHIYFVHDRLTWNRNVRRKLEDILKITEIKYKGVNILPTQWIGQEVGFYDGIEHLLSWWLLIIATTIYALYLFNIKCDEGLRSLFIGILTVFLLIMLIKIIKKILSSK